ncbi:DUF2268 domain-containing protein [Litchfieldia salsa]|uniref:Uncharacterized protein YjaZ n=1 Tax=Litchfieldia salsa TaxID=930152 RepID=A0A1H0S6R0_9BACI|nr:DUF2268 domain-containing protein [Litchfieldia salsa]SDP37347.1 Uncharacterized protein YjaZ [Litchfieldia salsa]
MTLVNTKRWLENHYDDPITICEKIRAYFKNEGVTASEIYDFLSMNGMYKPEKNKTDHLNAFINCEFWEIVSKERKALKKEWDVPNIPIFILPSDRRNKMITKDYNGKSGIAFSDKLFLFLSDTNSAKEVKAVFTHEYNHVYRLSKNKKNERKYHLLDTIILEGLAENAVLERLGETEMANWTTYYSTKQLERFWIKLILPNINLTQEDHLYHRLLYGIGHYPKMLGYCVGYHLVNQYLRNNDLKVSDIIELPSEEFILKTPNSPTTE